MVRRFNILILGPESKIGQALIRKINDHFHFLNIAIPTGNYKGQLILPPYQIALNYTNLSQLSKDFSLTEVVVSCSPYYNTDIIKLAASQAYTTFIDACFSYPQTVIEAACYRLPFHPTIMEASQSSSGCSIPDMWIISHQLTTIPSPKKIDGNWFLEQGTVPLEDISVVHRIKFSNQIYAKLFYFFILLLRIIIPLFNNRKTYSSRSTWWFSGRCLEHHQEYLFKAYAEGVDADLLRPDLALIKILNALKISRSEWHDWGCCKEMKVKLQEYIPVQN